MLKCMGENKSGERIFSLGNKEGYAVDESGAILRVNNNNNDTFEFTRFYSDTHINEKTKHKDIRNSIVNLESVAIDEYSLNLFEFKLDFVPYLLLIKGSSNELELLEKIKKLPLKHQFFARNEEVVVFIYLAGDSVVIKEDHKAKFHKDNSEIGNKKLTIILKSVACQFEKYEDFSKLKSTGQLDF